MNTNELKESLKDKLREIFQFDKSELDFGIYRIMNYKHKEIEEFIEKELINSIERELKMLSEEERKTLEMEFKEIKQKIKETLGEDAFENGNLKESFKNTPLGKEYYKKKKHLEEIKISEDLEREIYNHLINFFSRYYDNGDFISKRRYGKNEKYVVPYNGEEVLLYWANKDQYYIKTTEYFREYTFWHKKKGLKVNFKVIEAEEEKGNAKSEDKKFFILNEKVFDFNEDKKELNIYFDYRTLNNKEKEKYKHGNTVSQDKVNEETIRILKEKIPQNSPARLIFEKEGEKTLIEKHLYRYTRRNTTDYFIHKDLKGFLERELDFYIKNEFLQLEDLQILEQSGYFDNLSLYLIAVRAFRKIALKIIEFLAQIENFQKKIWEKKKFVINTHYVITLDKIKEYAGEEFLESILDEILKNEKQIEEWKELFKVEVKNKEDLIENEKKEWKKLPIDTKYFNEEFKWKLSVALSENNDLDEILDGVLIKSENWQALNLLLNKYKGQVQTIYIDPPYNTGSDDFLYKDHYQHSSWLTMMENRLSLVKEHLREDGVIFVSIGDTIKTNTHITSTSKLTTLMNEIFGEDNYISTFVRKSGIAPRQDIKHIANAHDYVVSYAKKLDLLKLNQKPSSLEGFIFEDDHVAIRGKYRLNKLDRGSIHYSERLDYPIIAPDGTEIWPGGDPNDKRWTWRWSKDKVKWGIENDYIVFKKDRDGNWKVYYKEYELVDNEGKPRKRMNPYDTFIMDAYNEIGNREIKNLFGKSVFDYPKPTNLVFHLLKIGSFIDSIILDFFAGSGTTAHAVMKLNKEDNGKRKFILIEMADYFDTIIIPRIKKVAYSFNWKEGKPQDTDGIGVFFKYHILEQYEDALENIEFEEQQKELYEFNDYFVKYMLEWETKNSKTFLDINNLKDPFNYKLKVIEDYQQKPVNVDLVEVFNYLIGLKVNRYKVLEDDGRKYVFVFGEKEGKRIVVVWRSIENIDFEKDKEIIESEINEFNPDEIYINGDAVVKGFKAIEPEFKSLMFEGAN